MMAFADNMSVLIEMAIAAALIRKRKRPSPSSAA
jgi:hypothetical protein